MMQNTLAFGMPGGWELGVILLVGVLIFGRRLPELARSVGKSVVEFKKGLRDVKGEFDAASTPNTPKAFPPGEQNAESAAPKPAEQKPESVQSDSTTK